VRRERTLENSRPKRMVKTHAPRKPSSVFFGLNWISGVRPNVMPMDRLVTKLEHL